MGYTPMDWLIICSSARGAEFIEEILKKNDAVLGLLRFPSLRRQPGEIDLVPQHPGKCMRYRFAPMKQTPGHRTLNRQSWRGFGICAG